MSIPAVDAGHSGFFILTNNTETRALKVGDNPLVRFQRRFCHQEENRCSSLPCGQSPLIRVLRAPCTLI